MGLNSYFDPIAEGSHLGGLAAVVAYKQKAEQKDIGAVKGCITNLPIQEE